MKSCKNCTHSTNCKFEQFFKNAKVNSCPDCKQKEKEKEIKDFKTIDFID